MAGEAKDLWASALGTLSATDRTFIAIESKDKLDVLADLLEAAERAKARSIEKRWRFRRPGHGPTVVLRDLFSKIVVWINRFREIGDIVVQYDPGYAALPWAGIRFLLVMAVSDIDNFDYIVEGAEKLSRCISRFAIFEHIYLQNESSRTVIALQGNLVRLYAAILIYLAKAKKFLEQGSFKRLAQAVVKPREQFKQLLQTVDEEQSSVDRYAALVSAEQSNDINDRLQNSSLHHEETYGRLRVLLQSVDGPICRMNTQLASIEDFLDNSKRIEILAWLSTQPYFQHHRQVHKQALRGTGQWLLQDPTYANWCHDSASSLLWLHGKPGSGKSTLTSIVIEDAIKQFQLGFNPPPVYFYCSRSAAEPERSDPDAILASILRQLSCIELGTPVLPPIVEKFDKQGRGFKAGGLQLEESQELIVELIEIYGTATIIVDALDECDRETRQSLLDSLEGILNESAGLVKVFVSSRDDQDIVCTLRDYPNLDLSSDEKNTTDIQHYITLETQRLVEKRQLLRNSSSKKEMQRLVIDQVIAGADGMFRWASLQINALCRLKHDEDIRQNLGKLPPKLEQLYLELYNDLLTCNGDVGRSIIENTLKWLLCARKTLSAPVLLWTLAVSIDMSYEEISKDHVLDLCQNLVLYDEGLDTFRFSHLSVREFLEKLPQFSQDSCHILAADCCLLQIIATSHSSSRELPAFGDRILKVSQKSASVQDSAHSRFLLYAYNTWMDHCMEVPVKYKLDGHGLGKLFRSFLSYQSESNSALESWTNWYCTRVVDIKQDTDAPSLEWRLQNLLSRYNSSLHRCFFIAAAYGFDEIVGTCAADQRLGNEERSHGVLLAALSGCYTCLDICLNQSAEWDIPESVIAGAIRSFDKKSLALLFDKAHNVVLTEHLLAVASQTLDAETMALVLRRLTDQTVTESMVETAITYANDDAFALVIARATDSALTERVLHKAAYFLHVEKFFLLLPKVPQSRITSAVVLQAISQSRPNIVAALLERSLVVEISEEMMIAATGQGLGTLNIMLHHGGRVTPGLLDKALESHQETPTAEVVLVLLEKGCIISGRTLRLAARQRVFRRKTFETILDHTEEKVIAREMTGLLCYLATSGYLDAAQTLEKLLDQEETITIPEEALLAAARAEGSSDIMHIFLEKGSDPKITFGILVYAAANLDTYIVLRLLDSDQDVCSVNDLLEPAAANWCDGGQLLKELLKRTTITDFPWALLHRALNNYGNGKEVIMVLEELFGQIELTVEILTKLASSKPAKYLCLRLEPRLVTEKVLRSALRNYQTDGRQEVLIIILDNALHVPITTELILLAAGNVQKAVFLFLWNRHRGIKDPKDLLKTVFNGTKVDSIEKTKFILEKCEKFQMGEELIVAAVSREGSPADILKLLLEHRYPPKITTRVLEAAIGNTSASTTMPQLVPLLLEQCSSTDISEKMFEIAASVGKWNILQELADFCDLHHVPEKWTDMAQFYNAAKSGETEILENHLASGIDPQGFPNPENQTPLWEAVRYHRESAVRILLSAGANPDAVREREQDTPLYWAAYVGHYGIVKLLVEAGASPDFRDENGRTPSMIAREGFHVKIAKFLQERMAKQKEQLEVS